LSACSTTLLAQRVDAVGRRDGLEPGGVPVANVLDVTQPVVGQADAAILERGHDATALRMADDDDVADLDDVGRELDHRQAIQVRVDDDVGDVAVDEQLADRGRRAVASGTGCRRSRSRGTSGPAA
jgi:hypothetical protein